MQKNNHHSSLSLEEHVRNYPPRDSIRYSMTKRIRHALNGIDTRLTCFCASLTRRTTDRRDERNKAQLRFRCGGTRGTVTYLSRRIPRTSIYGFNLPHLRAISTLFPRVVRSEFRRSLERPHAMHILSRNTFPRRTCTRMCDLYVYIFSWMTELFPKAVMYSACSGQPDPRLPLFLPQFPVRDKCRSLAFSPNLSLRTRICTIDTVCLCHLGYTCSHSALFIWNRK